MIAWQSWLNSTFMIGRARALLAMGAVLATSIPSSPASTVPERTAPDLYSIIDAFIASSPRDRETVERVVGTRLSLVSTGIFNSYEARNVRVRDLTLSLVDYGHPATAEATIGPMLTLDLEGGCLRSDEVLARYSTETTHSPTGHSPEELAYWTGRQPWGEISFGFPSGVGTCLKTVVLQLSPVG